MMGDVGRPEDGPTENGEQGREKRESCRKHDGDPDREGRAHALV